MMMIGEKDMTTEICFYTSQGVWGPLWSEYELDWPALAGGRHALMDQLELAPGPVKVSYVWVKVVVTGSCQNLLLIRRGKLQMPFQRENVKASGDFAK